MSIGAIKFAWGLRPRDVNLLKRKLVLAVHLAPARISEPLAHGPTVMHGFLPWLKDSREYVLSAMSYENGGAL